MKKILLVTIILISIWQNRPFCLEGRLPLTLRVSLLFNELSLKALQYVADEYTRVIKSEGNVDDSIEKTKAACMSLINSYNIRLHKKYRTMVYIYNEHGCIKIHKKGNKVEVKPYNLFGVPITSGIFPVFMEDSVGKNLKYDFKNHGGDGNEEKTKLFFRHEDAPDGRLIAKVFYLDKYNRENLLRIYEHVPGVYKSGKQIFKNGRWEKSYNMSDYINVGLRAVIASESFNPVPNTKGIWLRSEDRKYIREKIDDTGLFYEIEKQDKSIILNLIHFNRETNKKIILESYEYEKYAKPFVTKDGRTIYGKWNSIYRNMLLSEEAIAVPKGNITVMKNTAPINIVDLVNRYRGRIFYRKTRRDNGNIFVEVFYVDKNNAKEEHVIRVYNHINGAYKSPSGRIFKNGYFKVSLNPKDYAKGDLMPITKKGSFTPCPGLNIPIPYKYKKHVSGKEDETNLFYRFKEEGSLFVTELVYINPDNEKGKILERIYIDERDNPFDLNTIKDERELKTSV